MVAISSGRWRYGLPLEMNFQEQVNFYSVILFLFAGAMFSSTHKKKNRPRLLIFCVGKKRMVQKLDIAISSFLRLLLYL